MKASAGVVLHHLPESGPGVGSLYPQIDHSLATDHPGKGTVPSFSVLLEMGRLVSLQIRALSVALPAAELCVTHGPGERSTVSTGGL